MRVLDCGQRALTPTYAVPRGKVATNRLFVTGITAEVTSETLRQHFIAFGEVKSVQMPDASAAVEKDRTHACIFFGTRLGRDDSMTITLSHDVHFCCCCCCCYCYYVLLMLSVGRHVIERAQVFQ